MDELLKTFKKIYPDSTDKKIFYFRKDLKHAYLKGLHIVVDKAITVYCKEPTNKVGKLQNGSGSDFVIIFTSKSEKNLKNLLSLFE